jgi:uncharacterized membrane protein YdjX (TVP38/TMEM64 family)
MVVSNMGDARGVTVWARRAGIAALVVGLAYVIISIWDHDALVRWMSEASPVPFFLAMALLPAIGVPLSPFMVAAGATFGVWPGLVGSIAAIALNLCVCYAIAHTRLRRHLQSLFARFDYKVPDFAEGGRAAWRFAAAVKLAPAIPAFAKTYILAVTGVPFPIYFGVSLVISSAFAFAWSVLGGSLLAHDVSRTTLAAVALVLLVIIAVWWWKRRSVSDDALSAT